MAFYTVGRFQPPTLGHVRMIDAMLELAKGAPAFVFISSAKDSLIPSVMKKAYLEKMLTRKGDFPENLHLIDTAECESPCGGPLGGWAYLKEKGMVGPSVVLVVGSDQKPKFDPKTARMWETVEEGERPSIESVERGGTGASSYSSTKARRAIGRVGWEGLKRFLMDGSNVITEKDVEEMAKELVKKKSKWPKDPDPEGPIEGGGEEDTVLGEVDGGRRRRRKTLRRKRIHTRKRSTRQNGSHHL